MVIIMNILPKVQKLSKTLEALSLITVEHTSINNLWRAVKNRSHVTGWSHKFAMSSTACTVRKADCCVLIWSSSRGIHTGVPPSGTNTYECTLMTVIVSEPFRIDEVRYTYALGSSETLQFWTWRSYETTCI